VRVVEHDMALVQAVSDRVYFMDAGQVIADGPPHQVVGHPAR
jgi:ABC-type branched-subunit amino acid transport system ATPase component